MKLQQGPPGSRHLRERLEALRQKSGLSSRSASTSAQEANYQQERNLKYILERKDARTGIRYEVTRTGGSEDGQLVGLEFTSLCRMSDEIARARALLSGMFGEHLLPEPELTGELFQESWQTEPFMQPLGHGRAYERLVLAQAVCHRNLAIQAGYNHVAFVTLLSRAEPLGTGVTCPYLPPDGALKYLLSKLEVSFPACTVFVHGGAEVVVQRQCLAEPGQRTRVILDRSAP